MFMSADLTYHCLHMRIEDYRTVSHSVQLRKRYFSDILLPFESLFFPSNPNWHELRKQEKCSSLAPLMSKFSKTQ